MNAPTVSVIITTYNRSALVTEALASVFAQTWRDFEVIVVNDGSTDDTRAVLAAYGDRIRCIHQPNSGLNAARNAAIGEARGAYFALLDDDDLWEPYKLDLSMALLSRFPRAAFAFSNFSILRNGERITRDGLRTWHDVREWRDLYPLQHDMSVSELPLQGPVPVTRLNVFEADIYEPSLAGPWVLPAASLVRRSAVPSGLRFNAADQTCGDWEFFARLSHHGSAVFADVDAAINRSHEDAVRLTRLPRPVQLARRVAMTERLWLSDPVFMARNGAEVNDTLRECLKQLARVSLLSDDNAGAQRALARAAQLESGGRDFTRQWLQLAASVPGAGQALRILHRFRERLHA
jgi:glycosyltransferase involved in cell wall biosynthesis